MKTLNELAKEYQVFEKADKGEFQRKARLLQSIWREEQSYSIGEQIYREVSRPLGSRLEMPWAEETLANYLTDTIRDVVRDEVLDKNKSSGKLYGKPRIFNDLLSSQPLCFNLFGELQQDLPLATKIFNDLTPTRVKEVTGIEFEYSPGRGDEKYTGDRSAFDVYVLFSTLSGGKGFLGVEVKYHENLKGKVASHRSRYDEIAQIMGCFRPETLKVLKQQPLQQIWRDHLLAGIHKHVDSFEEGAFVFLYPRDNPHCDEAIQAYQDKLSNQDRFLVWTLEDIVESIQRNSEQPWIELFVDRYLNFGKIDEAHDRRSCDE